ncbi:MAG: hypothetical protein ACETWQ_22345 [Phycisphaerae bacterium]
MNSENTNYKKNDHKPSGKDDGPQTLALLQGIRNGSIDPKSLGPNERRPLVSLLKDEGQSTAEIAHLLKVKDRTIQLDKRALREEDTLTKDPKLVKQMAGRLVTETDLCIERIRKSARGKDTPASVKVDAEHRCFQIFEKTIERLQSLGYLPTAAQKVSAEFRYQTEEVLTLEQIDKEVRRLQLIEGNPSEKEKTETEIITQFEDESNKEKGNQNEQA